MNINMPEDPKPTQSLIIIPKDFEKYTKVRTLEQDQQVFYYYTQEACHFKDLFDSSITIEKQRASKEKLKQMKAELQERGLL